MADPSVTVTSDFRETYSLEQLGAFINEHGQVRETTPTGRHQRIEFPKETELDTKLKAAFREMYQTAIHGVVLKELEELNMVQYYLPQKSTTKPAEGEKTVPILITKPSLLEKKQHVIVVVNADNRDLGIWSYRGILDKDLDIGDCSAIALANNLNNSDSPGLVVLNPGQIFWSELSKRNMTVDSYNRQKKAVGRSHWLNNADCRVKGSETDADHLMSGLQFIKDSGLISDKAKFSIIAIGRTATANVSDMLQKYSVVHDIWDIYKRIKAIACIDLVNMSVYKIPGCEDRISHLIRTKMMAFVSSRQPSCTVLRQNGEKMSDDELWKMEKYDPKNGGKFKIPHVSYGQLQHHEQMVPQAFEAVIQWILYEKPQSP